MNSAAHPTARPSSTSVITLVLWSALLAGLGELALRLVARRLVPEPVFINPASVWLGPVSALLLFAPLILLAWAAGRLHTRATAWMIAVFTGSFLAAFDVLMLLPRLHLYALVILAAGVASQVVWFARVRPEWFSSTLKISTALLLAVSAAGAAVVSLRSDVSPSVAGTEPAPESPNVLFLVLDTVRALELSSYGYERPTSPRLAALAAEGVQFERAVATAPWTLPTHATLFTGHFQRDLSVGWSTPLDTVPPTLAEHFRSTGYATGGFIANLRYCTYEYGLGRGFDTYRDYALIGSQLVGSTMFGRRLIAARNALFSRYVVVGRKDARRVVDEFLDWQETVGDRPYFAFLNLFDAHEPYAPEEPYDLLFADHEPASRQLDVGRRHSAQEVREFQDAYDGAVASLDAQLGRLFDELRRRGALDRTIVVVTSDHGEEFAEHGHVSHGNGLHFPSLHVPLIVRWPGGDLPAGGRVLEPVSLADVPATIIDLAGTKASSRLAGSSLAPLWRGEKVAAPSPILSELYWVPNQPDWYPVSAGNLRSLVRGRYHLIAGPGDREELYDIMSDPFERHDLMGDPSVADTAAALRQALAAFPAQDRGGR